MTGGKTSWKENKWAKKILDLFRQGLLPKELAMSVVMGALIGVLPLFGVSTVIITALAIKFRFNLPLAIFITYVVGPLHLLFFIPFIKIGERIYQVKHELLSIEAIKLAFQKDYLIAFKDLGLELICGLTGWAVAAIPAAIILYMIIRFILSFSWDTISSNKHQ